MGYSFQKGFGWPHVLFVLVLIVVLAGIFLPLTFSRSGGPRTETLYNAKAIAGGLVSFKTDHGAYPCAYTRKVLEEKGLKLPPGNDANAYLAQLIVTEVIDSETYFHAANMPGIIKGDDYIKTPEKILSKGENGLAYIMTSNEEALSDVKSITPLVIAPILSNGEIPTFNPEPYQDYYVYGAVDGSGKQGKISPRGHAMSKDRAHLFQTGSDSLFGDEIPIIKMPRQASSPSKSTSSSAFYYLLLIPVVAFFWWTASPSKQAPPEDPIPEY